VKQKTGLRGIAVALIAMVISCSLWAQGVPSQQNRIDQQAAQNSNNGYNSQNNNHPTTPQEQPAKPHSKAQPIAKSQDEFNAYQAVAAKADPSEMEAAADDFAKKFPDSELQVAIYSAVMHKYQNINNSDKVLDVGHKILRLDPDNIPALALTSYVLAESTRETDLDRDQKYAEGLKSSQKVVKDINTLVVPPTLTPEQVAGLKAYLVSMADSAMAYIEMNQKLYPASEQHFKEAIDANKGADADPVTYLRLAVVQDYQKKYSEAMTTIDKALQVAESQKNEPVVNMAKSEKDRLSKLTTGAGTPPKPAAIKQ
jgi:tetratricopeptide (TPR) repeat protein